MVRIFKGLILLLFFLQVSCQEGRRANSVSGASLTPINTDLVDYNINFAIVNLQGQTTEDFLALDILSVHTEATCLTSSLGSGLVSEFTGPGFDIQIPVNTTVDLYIKSQALDVCVFVQNYTHDPLLPSVPEFVNISPQSPSRLTNTPGLFGNATPSSASVVFYSDALCTDQLATGSAPNFSQIGIPVTVPLNSTTQIHARTVDALGVQSACVFMAEFIHSDTFSPFPELLAITPLSPSNQSFTPNIRGTTVAGSTTVGLYTDSACSVLLAEGTPAVFETSGFDVTLTENATTVIYARSEDAIGEPSICALFTTYTHDDLPPDDITFTSISPTSPTNQTTFPRVIGTASSDTAEVVFYNSALCLNIIGTGLRSEFITTGSVANVRDNDTTQIYARAFDSSSNGTDCTFLSSYVHNTQAPQAPTFGSLFPASPTNQSTTPVITGAVEDRTTELFFYKDELCAQAIGQGLTSEYQNSGITLTADANADTSIYVQVRDLEGNVSQCFFHAVFSHSSTPAPDPVFARTFPASPSRVSTSPGIQGTADSTIATVRLYNESTCTNLLSTGTRGQFTASGIVTNVPANTTTSIYARATDVFGNISSCVFLTNYVHNNIQPLAPTYTSVAPVSPNNQSFTPTIFGNVLMNPASQLPPIRVDFFDSISCVSLLGQGTPAEYSGAGIMINVAENAESAIYGKSYDAAGNESDCTFLTFYTHNALIPAVPLYLSTTPGSPSYSRNIRLLGSYAPSSDFMNRVSIGLYTDSGCSNNLVSADPTLLTSSGIELTVPSNTTTSIYGRTVNEVGTFSACQFLTNFNHNDSPPINFSTSLNSNGSIRLTWNPDTLANPAPRYTVERSLQSGGPYTIMATNLVANNFNDQLVSNNTLYFYRVFASNSTGRSRNSLEASVTTAAPNPVVVNNLTNQVGDSAVYLSWSGFSQNLTYRIFRSNQFGGPFVDLGLVTTATTYQDLGLTNDLQYFYYVKARNPAGESLQSNITTALPKANPQAPTEFSISPIFSTSSCSNTRGVRLNWTISSYYNSFQVLRGNLKSSLNPIATTGLPFYDNCNPGGNEVLYYSVLSSWGETGSARSGIVGLYSSDSPNLSIDGSNSEVRLSWSVPGLMGGYSAGDLNYLVYKSLDPDRNFSVVGTTSGSTNFIDSALNAQGAFYYVQAYVTDVQGDRIYMGFPTDVRGGTAQANPLAPSDLTLSFIEADGRVQLDWRSPSHFTGFRLYRSSNELGPFSLVQTVPNTFIPAAPLANGRNYFRITSLWGGFESAPTSTVFFRNSPITGLNLISQSDRLVLSWNAVAGANDYLILRSSNINGPYVNYDTSATNTFEDLAVVPDNGYYYKVRARFTDLSEGQNSSAVRRQTNDTLAPSNVSLTVLNNTSIQVDWPRVAGATNYQVTRAFSSAGPFTLVGTTTNTTINAFGLDPQTEHFFRVRSTVAAMTYFSQVVSAYTLVPSPAPSGIVGNNQVNIFWSPMPGAPNYNIERSTNGGSFVTIATNYAMTNFVDITATNGQIYFYRIRTNYIPIQLTSASSIGFSPGRTPLAPSNLNAENNGTGTEVELKWADVTGRTSFNIYSSTTSGVYGAPIQTSFTPNGTRISGLTAGLTYYFRITALNGTNESLPSNEVSITPSSNPTRPTAQFFSSTQVQVTWDPVVGANSYTLLRSSNGLQFQNLATGLSSPNYLDSTVDPSKTYFYRYQPFTSTGSEMAISAISDPVNSSVSSNVPSGLHILAESTNAVQLYWSQVTNILNYEVLRSHVQGGPYTVVASPSFSSMNYTDTTVVAGQSYYYVIRTVNSSGVRSAYSNEVSIQLISGPANLAAVNGLNSIDLTWNNLPGVSSYDVLRSDLAAGPFGRIASSALNSASDSQTTPDQIYFYRVQGVYADGRKSVQSNVVSLRRDGSLRLQVPIELTDTAISSSQIEGRIFNRTLTSFNTSDYDGVASYQLEVVASNSDSQPRSVGITNQANNMLGFITVPANTIEPTLVKSNIGIANGNYKIRLELEQTPFDGQLAVYSAKLLVNQINATKTKIYYPLISSDVSPSNSDEDVFAYATSQTSYHDFVNANHFTRRASKLDRIIASNAWDLEVVVSTQGGAEGILAFNNLNSSQTVLPTETRFVGGLKIANIPFSEGIPQFRSINENHNYRLVFRCEYYCSSGEVRLHKAGLWVTLSNLTKASLIYRVTSLQQGISSPTQFFNQRANLDLAAFSSPEIFYQVLSQTDDVSQGQVQLRAHANVSGDMSLNNVTDSLLFINSNTVQKHRSLPLTGLGLADNYVTYVQPDSGQIQLRASELLVEVGL